MLDKKLIQKLRKKTGLGLLDCKNALESAQGDIQKAMTLLAEKTKHLAKKKLDREIEQGIIFTKMNSERTQGVLMALGCETDFVARNEAFGAFAEEIMQVALTHRPQDKEALLACPTASGKSVKEEMLNQIGILGENITLEVYHFLEGPYLASYIHTGSKLGALVVLNQKATTPEIAQAAQDMALHVVAVNPLAIDEKDMPPAILEKEREAIAESLKDDKKPEAIRHQIAQGKMKKFITTNALLHQPFVKDDTLTCQKALESVAPGLSLLSFKRIAIEG